MTDRELLELAAKAAGFRFFYTYDENLSEPCIEIDGFPQPWNPLSSDGDALRLAVQLKIDLLFTLEDIEAIATYHTVPGGDEMLSPWACEKRVDKQDTYAATRRAIVRAAAEIGKGME
ncbi:MAG: hypothetical protein ACO24B_08485 [Ilumatobacteraceae bacterium]